MKTLKTILIILGIFIAYKFVMKKLKTSEKPPLNPGNATGNATKMQDAHVEREEPDVIIPPPENFTFQEQGNNLIVPADPLTKIGRLTSGLV